MVYFKLLNIIAIGLQFGGVLLMATSDSLTKRIEVAYSSIPNNPLLEAYNAALEGKEPIITEEEKKWKDLNSKADPKKALRIFRVSLFLIAAGMLLQLALALAA